MQVKETTLQELISGMKQFRVPLFQRTYTWKRENHLQLWRDLMVQYDLLKAGGPQGAGTGHFIGSFVLAPVPSTATLPSYLVVDGQQRLTTLTLALCALRQAASTGDEQAFDRITNQYLVNTYSKGQERWKFVPTQEDRQAYFDCIAGEVTGAGEDNITSAYRFFESQMIQLDPDDEPLDLALLEQVIVSRLQIVDITAQQGDNVHRIFESLNATGVGLSQADLLRNYLFMLLPTRAEELYEQVWLPMQKHLGTENLEGLARVDLRRRGIDVRDDDVYRAQQDRLRPFEGDEALIEAEIRDLAHRAQHYAKILRPELEDDPHIRRRLQFLSRWRATTAHPAVMYLYEARDEGRLDATEMAEGLLNIESFLVRRLWVGVTNKNLNRIFIQLAAHLRQDHQGPILESLRYQLSTERKFWASDPELSTAAKTRPFYLYGRSEQRRLVLERLEESFGHREQSELSALALSVEHIMPQTLSNEWTEMLAATGEDPDEVHRELLHTLGNLTLTGYNSELSNHPFERKQQIFDASHLSLNHALIEHAEWARSQIEARAEDLAKRATQIWPGPVPGVAEPVDGFDWSRMHAAVATIPAGRWCAYSDLATLVGTAPAAVGSHIGAHPNLPNLWRVLTWDGRIPELFQWPDADDERDVRAVLESEGVTFDSEGRADQDLRVPPTQMQELLDWMEEEPEEGAA